MLDMTALIVSVVVFAAVMTQSVVGFGLALVAMPLLANLIGIRLAAPLVALVGFATQIVLLIRYRHALDLAAIKQVAIGSVLGIPLGVIALKHVNETVITTLLGVIIIAYALYALLAPRLPELRQAAWGYGFGLAGGVLTGAYNTGGPPLVIYGSCRNWEPQAFKGNIQALILLHSGTVLVAHTVGSNITLATMNNFVIALPAIALGIWVGSLLEERISTRLFRKVVLGVLIVLGLMLVF